MPAESETTNLLHSSLVLNLKFSKPKGSSPASTCLTQAGLLEFDDGCQPELVSIPQARFESNLRERHFKYNNSKSMLIVATTYKEGI